MSAKHENSDKWICNLPTGVYQLLIPHIKNMTGLRASCRFFRDKYKIAKYSDIDFKSKTPKSRVFILPQFGHQASLVYPLKDGRWVVIGDDTVISIMSCVNPDKGVLAEQLELHCEPLEYNYKAKFLVAELPGNLLVVMNHHTFYMWDISPPEAHESRQLAGVYDFNTTASATCLVNLSPQQIAFGFENNKIYVMNMKAGRLDKEIDTPAPVCELSVNFERKLVAVCESEEFQSVCYDPKKEFEKSDLGGLKPKKVMKDLKLCRIIVRNNQIYSENYITEGECETLWFSERVNNYQWQSEAGKLGAFKSFMNSDATMVFWNVDKDSQDLWIQAKEYPRTTPEFSF